MDGISDSEIRTIHYRQKQFFLIIKKCFIKTECAKG
nr:MAG TPA: hypothetical protein [Caudoviricetes sp.]